ncbi:MAG: thermonuclease family protein [Clostridia bacterium]|nr:thermonuclease family protein [Clostridia bacterium]
MEKLIKILSILMIVSLMLVCVVACDDTDDTAGGGDENNHVHVDYVADLKLDMTSTTAKQVVTVRNHVDGDTVHFDVPTAVMANGIFKARFLAVNTPESTGKIENYGHTASRFTKEALKDAHSIIIESEDDKWNADSTGGRYLVWIWYKKTADGEYRNLNVELLQNGLAIASNTANNRYGTVAMNALTQAKVEKLYVHSGVADPEVYTGEAVALTIKELRTNINDYNGIKVAVEGVVVQDSSQTVYVESYDEETDLYYGIAVYYGYNLSGTGMEILSMGNEVRVVGVVQYYETGGTWQISDVQYRDFVPDDPNNLQLLSSNKGAAYTLVDADTFVNGKVTVETETEDSIISTEYDFAECMLSASISMENLVITDIYTTNNGGSSDGAMTFTCRASDGTIVDVRTIPLYDSNKNLLTAADFEGKTINVKGVVDYFSGDYQIKVFKVKDITIVE